jgi:dihydrofolate synthase/folylpolyglutamate synthase
VDYRERIQAEGHLIEQDELVALVERLWPAVEAMDDTPYGGVTKFEIEAALGLAYWQERECEWVALEVGLGGRLDATNVVEPRVCAIVSIGLDHTSVLGHTLEEIASEKAGIIKSGVPVVVGNVSPEALKAIERKAHEVEAPLWLKGREFTTRLSGRKMEIVTPIGSFHSEVPNLGGFPPINADLAVAIGAAGGALPPGTDVSQGLCRAWIPGRFDTRRVEGRNVIFDGAHNPDAARLLASRLGDKPVRLVANMLTGHDPAEFYRAFGDRLKAVEIAPIPVPRALPVEEAASALERMGIPAQGHRSVYKAVRAALDHDEQIVVTGSNYLVGAALRLFG